VIFTFTLTLPYRLYQRCLLELHLDLEVKEAALVVDLAPAEQALLVAAFAVVHPAAEVLKDQAQLGMHLVT
jgi:hypothetical protein